MSIGSLFGAIMTGITTGVNAAAMAYRQKALVPVEEYGWDNYENRLSRYWTYQSYLNNTAYSAVNLQSTALKQLNRLYTNTRGIYNPVKRQNDLLVSYVYGGEIDMKHLKTGAIPFLIENEALTQAIINTFLWSRWGENKSLYVSHGANLGDVFLKACDDREKQKVRLEVIHPARVRQVELDNVGNITSAVIEYQRYDEPDLTKMKPGYSGYAMQTTSNDQWYTYTEVITKDKFTTYKNGEEFAFYNDMNGKPVKSWDNEYGFVPLVLANHNITGLKFGANAYYNSIRKIDEANDAASLLDDQIRKIIIPLLVANNVKKGAGIQLDTDNKDVFAMLYAPEGATIESLVSQIDITGAGGNIDKILAEIERDLPELALQNIRQGGTLTAPGVEAAYGDAISRIKQARGQYDAALERALKMAISIGGYQGYDGFESFSLDSYDRGDLDFHIKDRKVVNDTLSINEKIIALGSVNNMAPKLQEIALTEMGYDDQTVQEAVQSAEEQMRNAVRGAMQGIFGDPSQNTIPGKATKKQVGAGDKPKQLALPEKAN